MCPRPRRKALYRSATGWGSPLLHGAGRPPLSRGVLPLLRRLLGKGRPGVVGLVQRAVRPSWCPAGRLAVGGVVSRSCFWMRTNTQGCLCQCCVVCSSYLSHNFALIAPITLYSWARERPANIFLHKYLQCLFLTFEKQAYNFCVWKSLKDSNYVQSILLIIYL